MELVITIATIVAMLLFCVKLTMDKSQKVALTLFVTAIVLTLFTGIGYQELVNKSELKKADHNIELTRLKAKEIEIMINALGTEANYLEYLKQTE